MKLDDLIARLQQADPAAVLAPESVVAHVVRQRYPNHPPWRVPKSDCLLIDRGELFRCVEHEDLDLDPERRLPEQVILLARTSAEQLLAADDHSTLRIYWRRLFRSAVHRELGRRPRDVAARVARIGAVAFEEIRDVLVHDGRLPIGADDAAVYAEFAASYLAHRYFSPHLIAVDYPGLPPQGEVDALLAEDVDAGALLARSRPAGAPDPVSPGEQPLDESHDFYWQLSRQAVREAQRGNDVRAAILNTRAARIAPPELAHISRGSADRNLFRLMNRLSAVLSLGEEEVAGWLEYLPSLLDKADQGPRPVEAALLFDLQEACLDHERELYALDLIEWAFSGGKRPVKRPLPGLRLVRVTRHLRNAQARLTTARLTDGERRAMAVRLGEAVNRAEGRMRDWFRPALVEALADAGLRPDSAPQRTAFEKMIEELLDRVLDDGFITFSGLRDVIAANRVKLPDLEGPNEFMRGDPLLRLDRRLSVVLDGVYRRGDFYLRWLHRATSLAFGTSVGRWLTLNLALPFGGAFLLVEAPIVIVKHMAHKKSDEPQTETVGRGLELAGEFILRHWYLWLPIGVALWALIRYADLRRRAVRGFGRLSRFLRWAALELPVGLAEHWLVRAVVRSWPVQLGLSFLLKPFLVCLLIHLCWPDDWAGFDPFRHFWAAAAVFVTACLAVNSRAGRALERILLRSVSSVVLSLARGLITGLIRWVIAAFDRLMRGMEYVSYSVTEWLRFRGGESFSWQLFRATAGAIWYPIDFLLRFNVVVLLEPGFNPVKAPISIVAAKVMLPLMLLMYKRLEPLLTPAFGPSVAWAVAGYLSIFLPDVVGFLVWEMKENWRLYRSNRGQSIGPAGVGPHGETVRELLQPGFHSGTVPHLFARLRHAERRAAAGGDWRPVRQLRSRLLEVESALRRFIDRELVALLHQHDGWKGKLLVSRIRLATNRIRVRLDHADWPGEPAELDVVWRAGWLVAVRGEFGFVGRLPPRPLTEFANALAAIYKLAGIDLVDEQLKRELAAPDYELHVGGVFVEPDRFIDLDRTADERGDAADRLAFYRVEQTWAEWERATDGRGDSRPTRAALALGLTDSLPAGSPAP